MHEYYRNGACNVLENFPATPLAGTLRHNAKIIQGPNKKKKAHTIPGNEKFSNTR